jgi:small subunit ribosomal protein S16
LMVRIRLTRTGSKGRPFYRFVVMDSRVQRDGGYLDLLGHYNPLATPYAITVDETKVFDWLGKGATMTEGARTLLKKNGTLTRWMASRGKPAGEAPAATGGEDAAAAGEQEAAS